MADAKSDSEAVAESYLFDGFGRSSKGRQSQGKVFVFLRIAMSETIDDVCEPLI